MNNPNNANWGRKKLLISMNKQIIFIIIAIISLFNSDNQPTVKWNNITKGLTYNIYYNKSDKKRLYQILQLITSCI